ncbi:hypothetical protein AVEN_149576-1 [Araneus ventricosus]|uniref:BHLH domain-containing protein n=1 Tax=Araneus ventricosus TaxID=182803 RepID=A0A4Y2HU96_ARAVE|nr:hypothetical protein AVEN_149576-1 [Araneus ventricosus]
MANKREKERNRQINEGINNLHKIIHLKEWEKPTVANILKVAALYIEFLREKIGRPDCFEEILSDAQLNTKLQKEFTEWRLQREVKDLPKSN